jgi:hypothetical protein
VGGEGGGGSGEDGGAGERGGGRAAPLLHRHPPRRGLALRVGRVHFFPLPCSATGAGIAGCIGRASVCELST